MAIRENLEKLSPKWLHGDVGVRLIYVIGLHVDRLVEKALQGSIAHQPGLGTPTGLPALGAARLMPKGATELDDEYAQRLRFSWDAWGFAGSNRGILATVLSALLDARPDAIAVSQTPDGLSAVWDEYLSGDDFTDDSLAGAPSHVVDLDWNWDSEVVGAWWRVFVVIYSVAPNAVWTAPATWGSGGHWGDGRAWGCNESNAIGTAINATLKNWRAGHAWLEWWIVSFDADLFRSSNRPDGTWRNWGKVEIVNGSRTYVAARNPNASYANGPGLEYP
jgi:hypothetical protein